MSEDPIGFAAGEANLYRYVGNQPTMWIDPAGIVREFFGNVWAGTQGFIKGLGQGVANVANVGTDAVIGMANLPPFAWNNTVGWVGPEVPYIPVPDWSEGLITDEDGLHDIHKGIAEGSTAVGAGAGAVGAVGRRAARRAAERSRAARDAADDFFKNPMRDPPPNVPPYNPRLPRITPREPPSDYAPPIYKPRYPLPPDSPN